MTGHRVSSCLSHALVFSLLFSLFAPVMMGQANVQGRWSTLQTLMPINPIHVALLGNGKVLVVPGSGNCPPSQSGCPAGPPYGPSNNSGALLWDPMTGAITQFSVSWDMFCNAMALLKDGRALIDGGTIQYDPFYGQPQAAVFDPATNTFTNVQNMAHGRWYPTVVTLGDGRVMTFSGLNETGGTNTAVEFYTVGSGWSQQYPASWTPDLYPRLHLLPNGKVFYSGAQTTSKLFDPSTTTWNTNVATTIYGSTRGYGTSVLLPLTPTNNYDPQVIIMGGHSPATNTTEIIDMGAPSPAWQSGPNMSQARIEMNAVILPDGRVLSLGGSVYDEDTSSASLNADLLGPDPNNPGKYIFSSAGANAYPRLYHSVALLLPDATVWLAGGNPSRGSYVQQMEIYQPPYLFNSTGGLATRPSITSAPSSISYGNAFTVQTSDAASIAHVVLVRNGTVTHAFGMDQREVETSFTGGSGALTVTAPPNGNIAPPGYYMLFILNNSGVPSVAKFVQLTPQPDFSVAATPASRTVPPGTGTSYSMTVTPSNGFTGNVTFSVTGLPSGATASFSPSSVTGSGSSTLSVNTSTSTPTGSYTLTITATNGSNLTHSTQVTLVVADFALSASPSTRTLSGNSKTTYTVTVTALGPFSAAVTFSVSGLPARTSTSFSPTSLAGAGNTTLTVSSRPKAPTGTYPLTITATGGGLTHSTTVNLVIQ
jgi:Galactose oxidase-like, Early set domain/Glyoxal oxidase N-terminus